MPSTIVAYLAKEPDQALMVRGALLITIPVGIALLATMWILPSHVGVPLTDIDVSIPWVVTLTIVSVVASLIGAVIDPLSWLVRRCHGVSARTHLNVDPLPRSVLPL
jgi:hypothetical protein